MFSSTKVLLTKGVKQAFDIGTAREFDQWLASDKEAYFFLDSVDEARLGSHDAFEKAIRRFASTLEGALSRAIIVVSCRVNVDIDHGYYGGMASSSETISLNFLDGSIRDTRGFFCDASCGMHWYGERVQAYILYRLGLDPVALLRSKSIPTFSELEAELRRQHILADNLDEQKNTKHLWVAPQTREKLSPQKAKKLLTERLKLRLLRELQEKNEPPGGSKGT